MASSFPRLTLRDLFDPDYYRAANPDLADYNDERAFRHLEQFGLFEDRTFSPYFDVTTYIQNNPDLNLLARNRKVLVDHFISKGVYEGRLFTSLPIDLNFYRTSNPDLKDLDRSQLLHHLIDFGVKEGRRVSPTLDLNAYRANNPDLARFDNQELLLHFAFFGQREGRIATPEAAIAAANAAAQAARKAAEDAEKLTLFDAEFYRINNPDLRNLNDTDLTNHFLNSGAREGRIFSPYFNSQYYLTNNQDLIVANFNPEQAYLHFLRFGLDEGRRYSQIFDVNYYLANYADLRAAGLNRRQAFDHFRRFGLNEGRRPALIFDPVYYLANNPDLAALEYTNQRAFRHFQTNGFAEARSASIFFDPEAIAPLLTLRPELEADQQRRPNAIPQWLQGADRFDDIPIGGTLTYSFVTTASAFLYEGAESGVRELPSEIKNFIRDIMRQYDEYLPINFVEVPDRPPNVGRIRFMFSNGPAEASLDGNVLAYAYSPSEFPGIGLGGDVHLNPDTSLVNFSQGPGSLGYTVLLHEIGHALGLAHPFRDDPNASNFEPLLPTSKDNDANTVMTYNFLPTFYDGQYARTPMSYDIRALQYSYGASYTNDTDSIYRFDPGNFIYVKKTIWDAGGIDWLDFSALPALPPDPLPGKQPLPMREGYYFDMNEGGFLTAQNALSRATYARIIRPGGTEQNPIPPIPIETNVYSTTIAYGFEVENLIGSPGDDEILGNNLANTIAGGDGADIITGARGADTLAGGGGVDIFALARGDGSLNPALSDVIIDFTDGVDKIGLSVGLTLPEIRVTPGPSPNDTFIRIASTGEYLALLRGVPSAAISLDGSDFTTI